MTDDKVKKELKPFTLFNNETGQSFEIPVISGNDGPRVYLILDPFLKKQECLLMILVLLLQQHVIHQ